MVLDRILPLARHNDDVLDSRRDALFHHVLNLRLIDDRQHLLRLSLGRGQEPRPQSSRRQNSFAHLLDRSMVLRRRHIVSSHKFGCDLDPKGFCYSSPRTVAAPPSLCQSRHRPTVPYNFPSFRPPLFPLTTAYLPISDCLAPPTALVGAGLAPPACDTGANLPAKRRFSVRQPRATMNHIGYNL